MGNINVRDTEKKPKWLDILCFIFHGIIIVVIKSIITIN